MKLMLRDEMALRIAAALADSSLSPEEVASRAYATADALTHERERAPLQLSFGWHDEAVLDGPTELGFDVPDDVPQGEPPGDVGPAHDPRWETSPRWSAADRGAAARARREHDAIEGPGLASTRPKRKDEGEDDDTEAEVG